MVKGFEQWRGVVDYCQMHKWYRAEEKASEILGVLEAVGQQGTEDYADVLTLKALM